MARFLIIALLAFVFAVQAEAVTLVRNSKPCAAVVLSSLPANEEIAAAGELVSYINKMTGANLPVIKSDSMPDGNVVLVGKHPETVKQVGKDLNENKLGFDGIILKAYKDKLIIVGANPKGTKYAVYDLLKRLGCRFYLPYPDGEVVPKTADIEINKLNVVHKPDFAHRILWNNGNVAPTMAHPEWYAGWADKVYQGGIQIMHGHNYAGFVPVSMFDSHPEYFPLVRQSDGTMKRVHEGQLCLSNPDIVKLAADAAIKAFETDSTLYSYSLSPNDGVGWCECDKCKAMDDPDPHIGLAKRVLTFNNQVADIVSKKFPNKWLFYYGEYGNLPGPPAGMKAHPMLITGIVNSYDLLHGLYDRKSWSNKGFLDRMKKWQSISKNMFEYEWLNYSSLPSPMLYTVGERVRYYKKLGSIGYSGEVLGRSPVNDLTMYIISQMLWDSSQNYNKMINEFFTLYFAESAKPMERYYKHLHDPTLYSNINACNIPETAWTPQIIANLEHQLSAAKSLAVQDVVKRRLDREAKCLEMIKEISTAYRMQDKWATGDVNAKAIGKTAAEKSIELLKKYADEDIIADTYVLDQLKVLKRSVYESDVPVSKNSARMQPGWDDESTFGDIWKEYEEAGQVPNVWKFKTDPDSVGEKQGWQKTGYDYSTWKDIRIAEFWEAQGYDYNGLGWYKTKLNIPESVKGRKVVLYIGAADETVKVWIDGKLAGQTEGDPNFLWDKKFPVDITKYVTPGSSCEVTICVNDRSLMGGLWKNIKLVCSKS